MKCLECNRPAVEDYMIVHKGQIFCCDDCKATYYEDREEEPENHPYYSDYYAIREKYLHYLNTWEKQLEEAFLYIKGIDNLGIVT